MVLIVSGSALADLPSPSKNQSQPGYGTQTPYSGSGATYNPWQSYGSGYGNGSNYYNPQYYPSMSASTTTQNQEKSSDLLWLFTGSDASLKTQMHNGFHSNSQTTFWNRIWSIIAGAAYQKFVTPVAYKLGGLENQVSNIGANVGSNVGVGNAGTQYCYECTHPQTNPYATNPNSMAPIFGGTASSPIPSSGSAGNIRY